MITVHIPRGSKLRSVKDPIHYHGEHIPERERSKCGCYPREIYRWPHLWVTPPKDEPFLLVFDAYVCLN